MIFREKETFLFYNTISGQHFIIKPTQFIFSLIEKLQDIENGYCIEISDLELRFQGMNEFVNLLRENFCGDSIDQELTKMKPFSLYPVPSIMKNRERLRANDDLSAGEKIIPKCPLEHQPNSKA